MTRIIGIDPGARSTGYGFVDVQDRQLRYVGSGRIQSTEKDFPTRLKVIFSGVNQLITEFHPDEFAIESVFVSTNPMSALKLGQARGAAIAACHTFDLPVFEYSPRSVKLAVVGTGTATKEQMQWMVAQLLSLDRKPPSDPADALGVAICHAHTQLGYG